MLSNAGPWNDFEMLKPFGIKRKSDGVVFHHEIKIEEGGAEE
jgi:hypothetical protein